MNEILKKSWKLIEESKNEAIKMISILIVSSIANVISISAIYPFLNMIFGDNKSTEMQASFIAVIFNLFGWNFGVVNVGMLVFSTLLVNVTLQAKRVTAVANFSLGQTEKISKKLLRIILSQNYEYFLSKHSSQISAIIMAETQIVVLQFIRPITNIIAAALTAFPVALYLFMIDSFLAAMAILILASYYAIVGVKVKKSLKDMGEIRKVQTEECYKISTEAINGIKEIKFNGLERTYLHEYEFSVRKMTRSQVKAQILSELPNVILQNIILIMTVIVPLVLIWSGDYGENVKNIIPVLGVFAISAQKMIPEIQKIYSGVSQLQYSRGAVEKLYNEINIGQLHNSNSEINELEFNKSIVLQGVSYKYPNSEAFALKNINLKISKGQKVAIIGKSGSGKTTLLELLVGLLTKTDGSFEIDNSKIENEKLVLLRKKIRYVPQEVHIFSGSIRDNIALSNASKNKKDQELIEIMKICMLDNFKNNIGEIDLEYQLDERGSNLSGGQKQRVGIARALIDHPEILVLDEATSALDSFTEKHILKAIKKNFSDTTVLAVAHRLETIKDFDATYIIENGELTAADG